MKSGYGLRVAVGALAGLGLGAVGVLVLPPLVIPGGRSLDEQAADLLPSSEAVVKLSPSGTEPASPPPGPGFDTVRLEPDGSGVVAGRAEPGTAVEVLAGGEVVAEVAADADGRFVAFLSLAPSEAPRALSLRDNAGRLSEETVILAPTGPQADASAAGTPLDEGAVSGPAATFAGGAAAVAEVAPDLGPGPALKSAGAPDSLGVVADAGSTDLSRADDLDTDSAALPGSSPAPSAPPFRTTGIQATAVAPGNPAPEPEVAATAPALASPTGRQVAGQSPVLVSDAEGVRVLQPALPPGVDAEVLSTVALDAISYGGEGEVVVSGRGSAGTVRLYLDNQPAGDAVIGDDGSWSAELSDAAAGVYTLRLDQIGAAGEVVSRIETPFQREARSDLAAAMAEVQETGQTIAMRTVQPGNTLWAIARDRYGEPLMYVRVFEANRDRIRDPDLIYPGQVFVLPAIEDR